MGAYGYRFHLGWYRELEDAVSIAREARERWMPGYLRDCYEEFE